MRKTMAIKLRNPVDVKVGLERIVTLASAGFRLASSEVTEGGHLIVSLEREDGEEEVKREKDWLNELPDFDNPTCADYKEIVRPGLTWTYICANCGHWKIEHEQERG